MQLPDLLLIFFKYWKINLHRWYSNTEGVQDLHEIEKGEEDEDTGDDKAICTRKVHEPPVNVNCKFDAMGDTWVLKRTQDKTMKSRITREQNISRKD